MLKHNKIKNYWCMSLQLTQSEFLVRWSVFVILCFWKEIVILCYPGAKKHINSELWSLLHPKWFDARSLCVLRNASCFSFIIFDSINGIVQSLLDQIRLRVTILMWSLSATIHCTLMDGNHLKKLLSFSHVTLWFVQIFPGVWYIGYFHGLGPARTQSKMVCFA
jgi:hypothetical protein